MPEILGFRNIPATARELTDVEQWVLSQKGGQLRFVYQVTGWAHWTHEVKTYNIEDEPLTLVKAPQSEYTVLIRSSQVVCIERHAREMEAAKVGPFSLAQELDNNGLNVIPPI